MFQMSKLLDHYIICKALCGMHLSWSGRNSQQKTLTLRGESNHLDIPCALLNKNDLSILFEVYPSLYYVRLLQSADNEAGSISRYSNSFFGITLKYPTISFRPVSIPFPLLWAQEIHLISPSLTTGQHCILMISFTFTSSLWSHIVSPFHKGTKWHNWNRLGEIWCSLSRLRKRDDIL